MSGTTLHTFRWLRIQTFSIPPATFNFRPNFQYFILGTNYLKGSILKINALHPLISPAKIVYFCEYSKRFMFFLQDVVFIRLCGLYCGLYSAFNLGCIFTA